MALVAGTRIGHYEITSVAGAGGMGEVYRARDTRLNRDVALKLLPPSFSADPDRTARFQREAQVLAALNHPNIGAIYGLEEAQGTQCLILELVDGETLDKRIARGAIPVDEALGIAGQIADALAAAHEKGIVHRDLKPSNIALTRERLVKVLDFGLAKLVATDPVASSSVSMSPTITSSALATGVGMLLGTAAYMSPEQARGQEADTRSDIWAFGVVLHEMMTGARLFEGSTVSDTLASVLKDTPGFERVPVQTRRLLRSCLEREPKRRLQAVGDWRLLLDDEPTSMPAPAARGRHGPSPRRLRVWPALRCGVGSTLHLTSRAPSGTFTSHSRALRPMHPSRSRLMHRDWWSARDRSFQERRFTYEAWTRPSSSRWRAATMRYGPPSRRTVSGWSASLERIED